MASIASRLKEAREEKGWTQGKLAEEAGLAQGTVGNIESGARQSLGSLPRLADALGVRNNWLRDGELPKHPEPAPIPSDIKLIAEEFERREVPEHARQTIMSILSSLPLRQKPAQKHRPRRPAPGEVAKQMAPYQPFKEKPRGTPRRKKD